VSSDIRHIVAGPLSQTLAIALANGTIELRSIPSGILLHSLRKHQHSASTMLFVNGESELISHATNETNVLHWKIGPNPKATQLLVLPDASTRVFAVSPQGTYLAAASTNTATLQLITLTNNQPNGSHQPCPNGYVNLQFQTEEDISLLCNETSGFQLATYNWKQKSTRMRHKLPINDVDGSVFAKSGKELLVFSKSNANPSLFDTNTGQLKQVFSLGQLRPGTAALTEGSFRADGAFIAFVNGSERLWLWQIGSKQPGGFFEKTLQRHRGPIHSMVADPKGKWLATTGPDSSIKLWNISVQSTLYGTLQVELQGPTGGGGVLAVSPNGRWLAASDVHNQIVLWDLLSHQIKATMPKHTSTITHLAFSAFGTRLISVSKDDDTAIVWSVPDGNFLSFLAHQDVSFVTHHPFLPKVALGRTNQLIVQKLSIESPADNTHTITHAIPQRGLLSWLGFATGNTLVFVNEHVYTKDWTNPKSQATQLLSTSTTNPFVALHANKQLLAIQDGRDIAFYNLKEKKQLTHLIQHTAQRRDITAIAFGPHANLFFTAHDNGWIQSWSCPPNGTTP
jgi:WD40 repeat protein